MKSKLFPLLALAALPITALPMAAHADITIPENDSSVVYSIGNATPDWNMYSDPTEIFGAEYSSNLQRSGGPTFQGSNLAVTFNGTGITWIGIKGPNYGIASYSIDGGTPSTTDHYYGTRTVNQNFVMASGLPAGPHVLNVGLTAGKNGSSSDYWQSILGFTIAGSTAAHLPLSSGTVGPYSALSYTGTWSSGSGNPTDISGGHSWSNTAGSTASWTFTGSLIEVYGRPDYENGYMDVYIDTVKVATVDGRLGNVDDDEINGTLLFAKQLSNTTHTIKLVVDGTHDSGAAGNFVQIDELVAFSGGGGGTGGSLSGSEATPSAPYSVNPSSLGTTDWRVWAIGTGGGDSGNTADKNGGGGKVSTFSTVGSGSYNTWADGTRWLLNWTGGSPSTYATGTNESGYLWTYATASGGNPGYSFTVPASTTTQNVTVLVGGDNSPVCTMTAALSDGSASSYSHTDTYSGNGLRTYTFTYKAASAGQTLKVTYYTSSFNASTTPTANLIAAWLH